MPEIAVGNSLIQAPVIPLAGVTGSIGGAPITSSCATGTVTITGAATSMVAAASPVTAPGAFAIYANVSATNTVTVSVCNPTAVAATPAATTYNVRVIQ